MPISDMKCYFRCLFKALADTHNNNIMHRDVKPANFLYDTRTGEGVLCDFGLAEVSSRNRRDFKPEDYLRPSVTN